MRQIMHTENQVPALEKRITELEKENLLLQEKVAFLTRKLYGRSTEQTSSLGIEGQMSLFDEAESSADSFATLQPEFSRFPSPASYPLRLSSPCLQASRS
jgi:hypothetical protein